MVTIKDGNSGKTARVNSENEVHVVSKSLTHEAHQALIEGEVFLVSIPRLTVTSTEGLMLYIKNDGTKTIALTKIHMFWNGGTTNHNRAAYMRISAGLTAPDTNDTAGTASNTNLTSAIVSDVTVQYWDETGTGMTGFTEGGTVARPILTQGDNLFNCDGAFVLGPTDTMGFHVAGVETGEFSMCIRFMESNFSELTD